MKTGTATRLAVALALGVIGFAAIRGRQAPARAAEPKASATADKSASPKPAAGQSTAKSKKEPRMISVSVFNMKGELVGPVQTSKLVLSDAEWHKRLTPEQFKIVRAKGTERAFCGTLLDNKKEGVYTCVGCGLPLFSSDSKFHSGTGWPSFFRPIAEGNVVEHRDLSHGMVRSEILCGRCDGHLGHVFDDGPEPTGLRFCLNSESLEFTPKDELADLSDPAADSKPAAKSSE